MAKVVVRWIKSHLMVGTDSNGNSIVIGNISDDEDYASGIKPSDLLLLAAASCSIYDVVDILKKQRESFNRLQVFCEGIQLDKPPYTFKTVHLHYMISGTVNAHKLQKAIKLSEEKYCAILSTIRPGVEISSDYEICK
ncbi:MAG: OsmC family protein [Chloroflexi bacterium]|nr:OsmC family protein [Chloroflexota bacterium]